MEKLKIVQKGSSVYNGKERGQTLKISREDK